MTTLRAHAPALVGILNLTEDSFAGDGVGGDLDALLRRATAMAAAGADWLDVGAESSRPGARPAPEAQELDRVSHAVEALRQRLELPLAVDTRRPTVAAAAVAAGAAMVNDTSGACLAEMAALVRAAGVRWVLMHAPHALGAMAPSVRAAALPAGVGPGVERIAADLGAMIAQAVAWGVERRLLIADPGIGFGKSVAQNLALLRPQPSLRALGVPLYLGPSRKSFLGAVTGVAVEDRVFATAGAVAAAVLAGAAFVRVHDVAAMRAVVDVAAAIGDAALASVGPGAWGAVAHGEGGGP